MRNVTRRLFTTSFLAAGVAAPIATPLLAQGATPAPMLIYDDRLGAGWNNWSWAKTKLSTDIGTDVLPITVEGNAWEALFLNHAPFSTKGYSTLSFYVNGGPTGGQRIGVKAIINDKPTETTYEITLNADTWNVVEVPLAEIGAQDQTISGFWWQALYSPMSPWYITVIELR